MTKAILTSLNALEKAENKIAKQLLKEKLLELISSLPEEVCSSIIDSLEKDNIYIRKKK